MVVGTIIFVFGVGKQSRLAMQDAPKLSMENLVYTHDLVRFGHRKQLQRYTVQHRENSRVYADPERRCEHRHRREPGILRQRSRSIAQIAPRRFQRYETPSFSAGFLDAHCVSELTPSRVARFVSFNSPLAILGLAHFQMKGQLILQVPIQSLPLEQRLHSHPVAHALSPDPANCQSCFSAFCFLTSDFLQAVCITLAIAPDMRCQYSASSANFLRPAAVSE